MRDADAVARAIAEFRPTLVVHAAAWTDVDGAESDPEGAFAVNEAGSRNVARAARAAGAALVAYSTDYVFAGDAEDGYVESDPTGPALRLRRVEARGRARGARGASAGARSCVPPGCSGHAARTSCGRCSGSAPSATSCASSTTSAAARPTRATSPRRRSRSSSRCPPGTYHLAGSGSCSWYELASAIMQRAGLPARVVPIGSDELDRPAPRPACSILRSEHACTPTLPSWQAGLEACLRELVAAGGLDVKRILVTGGCGFIGSHFVRRMLDAPSPDLEVVNLDALTYAGNPRNLEDVADDPRYRFVHGSIADRDAVAEAADGCDAIVNFAAETHVDRSIHAGYEFVTSNVIGPMTLLA